MGAEENEVQELPGFKVFPILRFTPGLLGSPCPTCNGRNSLSDKAFTMMVGHHSVPVCPECMPRLRAIMQAAEEGHVSLENPQVRRHD